MMTQRAPQATVPPGSTFLASPPYLTTEVIIRLAMVFAAAIMFPSITTDILCTGLLIGVAMRDIDVMFDYQHFEDGRDWAEENGIFSAPYLMMAMIIWLQLVFAAAIMFDNIPTGIRCIEVLIGVVMVVIARKFDYQQYQDEREGARRREKLGFN